MTAQEPRAEKVLAWIVLFFKEHAYSPSMREIKEGTLISSLSVVSTVIKQLAAAGELSHTPGISRSIHLKEEAVSSKEVANLREALQEYNKYNRINNDLDSYLHELGSWALGEQAEKPTGKVGGSEAGDG